MNVVPWHKITKNGHMEAYVSLRVLYICRTCSNPSVITDGITSKPNEKLIGLVPTSHQTKEIFDTNYCAADNDRIASGQLP